MVVSAIGSEFWVLSAKIPNPKENMEILRKKIFDYGTVSEFIIPEFKVNLNKRKSNLKQVGTLDTLIGLSDDLARHDIFIEGYFKLN